MRIDQFSLDDIARRSSPMRQTRIERRLSSMAPSMRFGRQTLVSISRNHPYAYVDGNPLVRLDPTGERWIKGGKMFIDCYWTVVADSKCSGCAREAMVCTLLPCQGWMWEPDDPGRGVQVLRQPDARRAVR